MLEFIPSIGSVISYGFSSVTAKKAITILGRHKAIVYAYVVLVILLAMGVLILKEQLNFPIDLFPFYLFEISMGAIGAMAAYKAMDYGKVTITSPVGKIYVLFVLAGSIIFLGEELSAGQVLGSIIMVLSALVLSLDNKGKLKPEKWMFYLGISIACRAFYFTFIKNFVIIFGPYLATFLLETGIAAFTVLYHTINRRDLSLPPIDKMKYAAAPGVLIFVGSIFYNFSISYIGAALTAAISAGGPIVSAIGGYLLLKEKLDLKKYAAIILMVLGLVMIFVF
ncbi:EamA family transporter [Candidatus Micrarchaeota archaeon]|nr:EamA family transporter [Candidatus Micrarchaeota archaeon]